MIIRAMAMIRKVAEMGGVKKMGMLP